MNLYFLFYLTSTKQIFSHRRNGGLHRSEKNTIGADVVSNGEISGDSHMYAAIPASNKSQLEEASSREKATTKMF